MNKKLKYFNFFDENKPPKILETHIKKKYLTLSASEMKVLVRIFGILVGQFIPKNDTVWELYKALRQICSLVEQSSVTSRDASLLQVLIAEHHKIYITSFGNLKPKHHFLTHYPRIMAAVGPLANISCIRYEAKHHIFKLNSKGNNSRINIPYSLAIKNQLRFNYRILSKSGLNENVVLGPIISCKELRDYLHYSIIQNYFSYDITPQHICSINWIRKGGALYKCNLYVAVNFTNFAPVFGQIQDIISTNDENVLFVLGICRTQYFDEHIQSYIVEKTDERRCIHLEDLIENNSFHLHTLTDGRKCVQMAL